MSTITVRVKKFLSFLKRHQKPKEAPKPNWKCSSCADTKMIRIVPMSLGEVRLEKYFGKIPFEVERPIALPCISCMPKSHPDYEESVLIWDVYEGKVVKEDV